MTRVKKYKPVIPKPEPKPVLYASCKLDEEYSQRLETLAVFLTCSKSEILRLGIQNMWLVNLGDMYSQGYNVPNPESVVMPGWILNTSYR
jgi:trehalose utilization protein